ncbi:MAG: phosphoenolpyruvate--protein phosphotransferase [Treponema sp.]|jgi:phosphotransferase system enzyme I (PtsI)|nr:phosphoenolpyruvate--protein phosphotransferase [Treponema sp.]
MAILQGKGVSGGIAVGRLEFFVRSYFAAERETIKDADAELIRFETARKTAEEQLDQLSAMTVGRLGKENAELFNVHKMMLKDEDFLDSVTGIISEEKLCAEYAVVETGKRFSNDFAEMDDDYMKERAADVLDVAGRVLSILNGGQQNVSQNREPVILASDDFSPSETAQFDRSTVLGLATRQGSGNSHTAIFARTMGIPAVIGLGASLAPDLAHTPAALDGDTGQLYTDPKPAVLSELKKKQAKLQVEIQSLERFRGKPTETKSGRAVRLFANIGSVADADAAVLGDAEGIGLFRSEFLYLERGDYPDEQIQYEAYRRTLEKMKGKQVIIRTLDIGADKQAAYFKLPAEENPALGFRAIRICLARPEVFKTQLRAIYRASLYGNAAIMFPLINSVHDIRRAKKIVEEVRRDLDAEQTAFDRSVPIGIMIETPAAAIISDLLAREVDFFSIGTNDLTQYTLAVDRQNESIQGYCDIHHEAILRLIRMTVENARKAGIPAGICGSLAADPALTQTFVEMGVDELSVVPSAVLRIRRTIAEME